MEASISIDEPGKSVIQYLNKNFIDINEDVVIISNYDTSFGASKYNPNNYQNYNSPNFGTMIVTKKGQQLLDNL